MSRKYLHAVAILMGCVCFSVTMNPAGIKALRCVEAATNAEFSAQPPFLPGNVPPLVMFAMSKDHKLFYKAYTDYSDLDGDGSLDTTYDHDIDYYGYFDCYKCYKYQSNRFEPVRVSDGNDKICDQADEWSGNFLNWATMARIDTLRKVLYGGYRSTDDNTETVLERTFIPQDAHSWVKIYTPGAGDPSTSDLTPFSVTTLSICNTTKGSYANPPLMRVADGSQSGETGWPRWSSNERWQCACDGEGKSGEDSLRPHQTNDLLGNYYVRVQVCVPGLLGSEKCKTYPNGNIKPYGLLQTYGEADKMYFGLMTGSYNKNKSGGVLRKNIGSITDEITANTGVFTGAAGIIDTLNKIKIVRYNYSDGTYNSTDSCSWGLSSFTNGQCTNWGNPIGEIFYEALRYYSGKSGATSAFNTDDSGIISGLSPVAWSDPYGTYPYCSKPFVMVISDVTPSFDSDQVPGSYFNSFTGDLSVDVETEANTIGTTESLSGDYFIGQSGATTTGTCSAKTLSSNLGRARGLCPEEPDREGTYHLAGLSYYGKTTDLRTDLTDSNFGQSTSTYAIALSSPLPEMELTVNGSTVTVMPACYNNDTNRNCALVHFEVLSQGATSGSYYVNWEDSEQGGDYDMDSDCILYYEISGSQITFRVEVTNSSSSYDLDLGYVVSGTTDDGVHLIASNNGVWFNNRSCSSAETCNDSDAVGRYEDTCTQDYWCGEKTHTVGTSSASLLKNPLWYAAKWGGFNDKNSNDLPDQDSEWDENSDSIPDTYFYVTNPLQLETQLGEAFASILERMSSGTAAAVVADSQSGVGALYQAIFYPQLADSAGKEVTWIGDVKALWLDEYGNMREDSNGNATMELAVDKIVDFYFDSNLSRTRLKRYMDADADGERDTGSEETVEVDEMVPLWSAGKQLAERDLTTHPRNTGTWVDKDGDGIVDGAATINSDEVITFYAASPLTGWLRPFLGQSSDADAEELIEYILGEEKSGLRSRTIDVDGTDRVWRLGDIVYSTPTVVGAPKERYDVIYGDTSYATFKYQYENRRQVVYVGANDGFLHAFNGGFYDKATRTFTGGTFLGDSVELGDELWGYIPQNLLPHLQWLALEGYNHVYYVDLKPKVIDARIFADDATHPGGWGTVLICGMRLGGGPITLTDDFGSGSAETRTFRSAYFALDITDPDSGAPTVLWEFTDANLGFTISYPAVAFVDGTTWVLAFGSGPDSLNGTSGQNGRVYFVNLLTGQQITGSPIDTGEAAAFMGSATFVDMDMLSKVYASQATYTPDRGYIGISSGKMYRITDMDTSPTATALLDLGSTMPITAAPSVSSDDNGRLWVYFGSGKLFVDSDQSNTDAQALVGVKEPINFATRAFTDATVSSANLLNTTSYSVFEGGCVDTDSSDGYSCDMRFEQLEATIEQGPSDSQYDGWMIDLTGGERCITKPTVLGGLVTFSTYLPNVADVCKYEGQSYITAAYYKTGTAYWKSVFGTHDGITVTDGGETKKKIKARVSVDYGVASSPSLHIGKRQGAKVIVQTSTGEVFEIQEENLPEAYRSRPLNWIELGN
jgi:type IV pilus assembly protein PilY1